MDWDFDAHELRGPFVAIRKHRPRSRRLVVSAEESAALAIGPITPGIDISGVTKGQFSMVDILEHVLRETGPADVAISTWTTGIYDQARAFVFYENRAIRAIRWILDPSMLGRKPELARSLVAAFGKAAFRTVNTHAKFTTVTNERFQIVIRGSMNLNPNSRLENFDLTDDPEFAAFYVGIVDQVFATYGAEESFTTQADRYFERLFAKEAEAVEAKPVSAIMKHAAGLTSAADLGARLKRLGD